MNQELSGANVRSDYRNIRRVSNVSKYIQKIQILEKDIFQQALQLSQPDG